MKYILIFGVCFHFSFLFGQKPDQKTPEGLFNTLVNAALTNNPGLLKKLCPPDQSNDGDTDCICALDETYNVHKCSREQYKDEQPLTWDLYVSYFRNAKIIGVEMNNNRTATIAFQFGEDGKLKETMRVVRIKKKWYMVSF